MRNSSTSKCLATRQIFSSIIHPSRPTVNPQIRYNIASRSDCGFMMSLLNCLTRKAFPLLFLSIVFLSVSVNMQAQCTWSSVSGGRFHSAGIESNGSLWTWGRNLTGQLGDSTYLDKNIPTAVGADKDWQLVSCGGEHTVAIKSDGSLWAWGANWTGQLGDGTFDDKNVPVRIGIDTDWKTVSCGYAFTVAIKTDGTLWSWGINTKGQLGIGSSTNNSQPTRIGSSSDWNSVSCGGEHAVALANEGSLWAWGLNDSGQLGDGTNIDRNQPTVIGNAKDWSAMYCGTGHTLALRKNGSLWAWGDNSSGQLGDSTNIGKSVPTKVGFDSNWKLVSGGGAFSSAIKSDGSRWAWGANDSGQLGDGSRFDILLPTHIGSDSDWMFLGSGYATAFAIKTDGFLWAWGANNFGQLGNRTNRTELIPNKISEELDWIFFRCGDNHSVAIKQDGSLWSWGNNELGQLGDSTVIDRNVPMKIGSNADWQALSCGGSNTVAVKKDGSIWAWGSNDSGQLGDSTMTDRTTPVRIGTSNSWKEVSSGFFHTVATQNDGSLWAWGSNIAGQLGDGTEINKNVPSRIGTGIDWKTASCGGAHSFGIKNDGSLWAWGLNDKGQLGEGTFFFRTSPTRIGTSTDWKVVSSGFRHNIAIKNDGSLWAWGYNGGGQLGDGTLNDRKVPVRIGADTDWETIGCGKNHSIAIKNDGSLWAWGTNEFGQLGDSTLIYKNVPVRIGVGNDWKVVSCGLKHSIAMRNDGSLWSWGGDDFGQLGNGNLTPTIISNCIDSSGNLTFEVTSDSAKNGEQKCIDIKAYDFKKINGFQYSHNFDPTKLQFVKIEKTNSADSLPFLALSSFNTAEAGQGRIMLSWTSPSGVGTNLPNGTTLYRICFNVIGSAGATDTVKISNVPVVAKAVKDTIPSTLFVPSIKNGLFKILGNTSNAIGVVGSVESGPAGSTVCMKVTVTNFKKVTGMQYSMNWDPTKLEFSKIILPSTGGLPKLSTASFNTLPNQTNAGKLSVSWSAQNSVLGETLLDNTVIYEVCFKLLGSPGSSSTVSFTDNPVPHEFLMVGANNALPWTPISGTISVINPSNGTEFKLSSDTLVGLTGETLCFPVRADNFTSIVAFQFSMGWNPSVAEFVQISYPNPQLIDPALTVSNFNISNSQTSLGIISSAWVATDGLNGHTLPKNSILFYVCLKLKGTAGQSTLLSFTDDPVNHEILGKNNTEIDWAVFPGKLTIGNSPPPPPTTVKFSSDTLVAATGDTVCFPVRADNFASIGGFQFSLGWNPAIAEFIKISYPVPQLMNPALTNSNFNISGAETSFGKLSLTWVATDGVKGQTLPKNSILFYVCLKVKGATGQSTLLNFTDDPVQHEILDNVNDSLPWNIHPGKLIISTLNSPLTYTVFSQFDASCYGASDASITVLGLGGAPPYSYLWSNGKTTANVFGLSAGTYKVTISDANLVSTVASIAISQPNAIGISTVAQTNITCAVPFGSAAVSASGGTGSLNYQWSNGQKSTTSTNLSGGIHTVTVSDDNNCISTKNILITVDTMKPFISAAASDTISCFKTSAQLTTTSNPILVSYNWFGAGITGSNQNLQNPSVAIGGSYTVTITNSMNSCYSSKTVFVATDTVKPKISIGSNSPLLVNDSLKLFSSGGSAYFWSGPGGFVSNAQNPFRTKASANMAGSYMVTVTANNGCTAVSSVNVVVTQKMNTSISTNDPDSTICLGSTVNLTANPSGLKYLWSNGATTQLITVNPNASAKYYVTITNTILNIQGVDSISIKVIPSNTAGLPSSNPAICVNTMLVPITMTTTGATGISIPTNLPIGVSASWLNNKITISGTPINSGTYVYNIALTGGCGNVVATGSITVAPKPNSGTLVGNQNVCIDATTQISVVGGTAGGTWSSSNNSVATVDQNGNVTGISAGSTTIVYKISGGGVCADTASNRIITVQSKPNAGILIAAPSICVNDTTQFVANGGSIGGFWSSSNSSVAKVDQNGLVIGTGAGVATISYAVTGGGFCAVAVSTRIISVQAKPNAGTMSGAQSICIDGTAQFSLVGATTGGTWSSSDTTIAGVDQNGFVTAKVIGTTTILYKVSGSGICPDATASAVVNITSNPNAGILSGVLDLCVGASTQFSLFGGTAGGIWSTNDSTIAQVDQNGWVTGKNAGVVTVSYRVTSAGKCPDAISTKNIKINPLPQINKISGDSLLYCGRSVMLKCLHNETDQMAFAWNNISKSNTQEIKVIEEGTYQVTMSSINTSCSTSKSIRIVYAGVDPSIPKDSIILLIGRDTSGLENSYLYIFPKDGYCYKWLVKIGGQYKDAPCLNGLQNLLYCELEKGQEVALAIWDCKNEICKDTITAIRRSSLVGTDTAASYMIYPNPTSSDLALEIAHGPVGNYQVQILDLIGRTMFHQQICLGIADGKFSFDLGGFASGTYIFLLSLPGGGTMPFKVIKVE